MNTVEIETSRMPWILLVLDTIPPIVIGIVWYLLPAFCSGNLDTESICALFGFRPHTGLELDNLTALGEVVALTIIPIYFPLLLLSFIVGISGLRKRKKGVWRGPYLYLTLVPLIIIIVLFSI